MEDYEFDNVDFEILNILQKNAKKPYTEVAAKVNVSPGTVHVRMRKMEAAGLIRNATLEIDHTRLGYDISAFLGIYLEKSSLYDEVVEALMGIPEIVNLHYTTGSYSIFARIVCRDTQHLRNVLHDGIQKIEGIDRTETFISLEERLNRPVNLSHTTNTKSKGTK